MKNKFTTLKGGITKMQKENKSKAECQISRALLMLLPGKTQTTTAIHTYLLSWETEQSLFELKNNRTDRLRPGKKPRTSFNRCPWHHILSFLFFYFSSLILGVLFSYGLSRTLAFIALLLLAFHLKLLCQQEQLPTNQ